MRTSRRALLLLLAAAPALAAGGCGEPRRSGVSLPSGPPRWHAVRGEKPPEGTSFTLDVRSPVRLAFRYQGPDVGLPDPPPRLVPAGTSVTVVWGHRAVGAGAGTQVAPPDAAAAGRTENHGVEIWFGWDDGLVEARPVPWWTRPGLGRVLVRNAVPPLVDEDLPVGSRLELVAAAVVDVAEGEARLVPGPSGSRVRMPDPGSPGDASTLVRVVLEVLPP